MTEYQNRTERRNLQRVELRKIRTEYKKSIKTFSSKPFDYNAKKFRKSFFYYRFKQASKINAAVDSTATCEYQEEGITSRTETDMVSYNQEYTSQAEDQIHLVTDRNNQVAEGGALLEEGVQVSELVLSKDIEHVVESAHVADIAEETSSTTEHRNRCERRSLQRVELRKIRTDYKRQMKGVSCRDYNAKKLKKTLFFRLFKQENVITTEDTTKNDTSDNSAGQVNTVADSPVTLAYKEEGPSAQVIADMVADDYECNSVVEGINIAVDRKGYDAEEVPGSGADNFIIMADNKDVESFKLEWNTLSLISEDLFDGSMEKLDNEDHLDEKKDEDKEEEYERSLDTDSSFYEKYLKEEAWMVTPPSSIMSVICEEKTFLLIKTPRSNNDVASSKLAEKAAAISAIEEATFTPVQAVKKKRLRVLKEKAGTIVPKIKTAWKRLFN